LRTPDELKTLLLGAGFGVVMDLANPMPLHTRLLLAQKK
jgi:hypothetical protein